MLELHKIYAENTFRNFQNSKILNVKKTTLTFAVHVLNTLSLYRTHCLGRCTRSERHEAYLSQLKWKQNATFKMFALNSLKITHTNNYSLWRWITLYIKHFPSKNTKKLNIQYGIFIYSCYWNPDKKFWVKKKHASLLENTCSLWIIHATLKFPIQNFYYYDCCYICEEAHTHTQ